MTLAEIKDYERYKCLDMVTGEYIPDTLDDLHTQWMLTEGIKIRTFAKWLGHTWKDHFRYSMYNSRYEFFPINGDTNDN